MCPHSTHPLLFGDVHDLKESLELFAGGDRARGREIFNTREFAVQAVWPVDSSLRVDVNESGTKELEWTDEMAHRQSLVDVLKELNLPGSSYIVKWSGQAAPRSTWLVQDTVVELSVSTEWDRAVSENKLEQLPFERGVGEGRYVLDSGGALLEMGLVTAAGDI